MAAPHSLIIARRQKQLHRLMALQLVQHKVNLVVLVDY